MHLFFFFSPQNTLWFPIWSYFRFTGCTLNISFYALGYFSKAGQLGRLKFSQFFLYYICEIFILFSDPFHSLSVGGILSFLLFRADWLKTVRMSDNLCFVCCVDLACLPFISSFSSISTEGQLTRWKTMNPVYGKSSSHTQR